MKSLLWKLIPGAVALLALQIGFNHFAHADTPAAPAPRIEAPAAYQRPAAPDPVRLETAAPTGQLVCGVCGNYLQAPRPVLVAMPYAEPAAVRDGYGYAEAPAARRLAYIDEDGVAVYQIDYQVSPPPLDPFPFASQGRMPARFISPYSANSGRPVVVPVGQHFHRRG